MERNVSFPIAARRLMLFALSLFPHSFMPNSCSRLPSRLREMLVGWLALLPPVCRSLFCPRRSPLAASTSVVVVVGHIIHLGIGAVALAATTAAAEARGRERAPVRCSANSGRAQPPRDVIRDARGREAAFSPAVCCRQRDARHPTSQPALGIVGNIGWQRRGRGCGLRGTFRSSLARIILRPRASRVSKLLHSATMNCP